MGTLKKILPCLWLCACALALLIFFPDPDHANWLGAAMMVVVGSASLFPSP